MTGSNIALPPLVSTSSRAVATALAEGCAAASTALPKVAQASSSAAARRRCFMDRSFLLVSGPLDDAPAVGPGDDRNMGEPDEKPVFHHSRDGGQPPPQRARIGDPLQRGVENEMAAIRDKSVAGLVLAQRNRSGTSPPRRSRLRRRVWSRRGR